VSLLHPIMGLVPKGRPQLREYPVFLLLVGLKVHQLTQQLPLFLRNLGESKPAIGKHLLKKRDSIKGLIQDLFQTHPFACF